VKGEIKFINEGYLIIKLLLVLPLGTNSSKLNSVTIKGTSEWLLQNIEKYPKSVGAFSLGISVWLLYDSFSDNEAVNEINKEYCDLLNTNSDIFKKSEYYVASLFTGLGAIINAYNWGELHKLVHQLEKTGYII
jgi:hypothetical protein